MKFKTFIYPFLLALIALVAVQSCAGKMELEKPVFSTTDASASTNVSDDAGADTLFANEVVSNAERSVVQEAPPKSNIWTIVQDNWGALIAAFLGFLEVIIRLTPSEKDNSIFNFIKKILDWLIPNKASPGGSFK
jgi:hypothetical protein